MADNKKISQLLSGTRGVFDTLGLGFADEAEGAAMAAKDAYDARSFAKLQEMLGPRIAESRQNFEDAKRQNPAAYGAGQGVGFLGSMLIPGGALAQTSLKAAALAGAGYGGLSALGNSNVKDLSKDELIRAGRDTALGAGIGAAGGAAIHNIPRFEKLMREIQPRKNLPSSAPQKTAEEIIQQIGPEKAEALGLSKPQYNNEVMSDAEIALRRFNADKEARHIQLAREAEERAKQLKLNVPSDTIPIK